MAQKSFVFDINQCTGCQACQIACMIENDIEPGLSWREINTFNISHHPDISTFHLSLACNHCLEAPCIEQCPAKAINKNLQTGAVIINPDYCIGCKFCSWVCPYDAPKFNMLDGIMEKCTFCEHRLEENLSPACVSLCPTGALKIGDYNENGTVSSVEGFTDLGIKPAIKFIPLRKENVKPKLVFAPIKDSLLELFNNSRMELPSKIEIKSEWILILFTLMTAVLASFSAASIFVSIRIDPFIFFGAGLIGMILSSLHLGKKERAYRAVLNWRSSWLSREIIFYSLFMMLSFFSLIVFPGNSFFKVGSATAGYLTLYSMDKIYSIIPKVKEYKFHSAQVMITGILFTAILTNLIELVITIILIKFVLYLYRKFKTLGTLQIIHLLVALVRITLGFIVPLIFIAADFEGFFWLTAGLLLFGELIDRTEFYMELDVITPAKQMKIDLNKQLEVKRN